MPAPAIESRRSSHRSRSSSDTSLILRHAGERGQPEILCSGMTRPSSRMKSRQTKPQRTSRSVAVSDTPDSLLDVLKEIFAGLQVGASPLLCVVVWAVDFIIPTSEGYKRLSYFFRTGPAAYNARCFHIRSRPVAARKDAVNGLFHSQHETHVTIRHAMRPANAIPGAPDVRIRSTLGTRSGCWLK